LVDPTRVDELIDLKCESVRQIDREWVAYPGNIELHRMALGKGTYLDAFELVVFMFVKPLLTIISIVHDHDTFPTLDIHALVTDIVD
jgi:hypothetical protein